MPMQGSTARATTPLCWRQLAEAGSIIYSHAVRGLDSMSGVGLLYEDRVVPAVASVAAALMSILDSIQS
jgi:hypothetical protein